MKGKFIEVADVLGLGPERRWLYIPGYNGYEISTDGYLRSMKHYKKYPTGILIRPVSGTDTFEISNDHNKRVRVNINELKQLAEANKFVIADYPRKTYVCDMAPRNNRAFIPNESKPKDEAYITPKFTVIKETQQVVEKKCPVYDLLERGLYYGREKEK